MDNLLLYLLKVTAGTILLYGCFLIFLSRDTFYKRNRILLLLTMVIPVVIPLMVLRTGIVNGSGSLAAAVAGRFATAGQDLQASVSGGAGGYQINGLLYGLWVAGCGLLVLRTALAVTRTYAIIRKGELKENKPYKVLVSDLPHPPFSFYPYAVIPRDIYSTPGSHAIVNHEKFHLVRMHTFDLLFSELFIAVFWFNPVAWFIKRSIVLNHEYQADNETVHEEKNIRDYQYSLLGLASGASAIPVAHNFSTNIKNRITMINKTSTSRLAGLKVILYVPAILLLLASFSYGPASGLQEKSDSQDLFSSSSQKMILEHIYTGILYPDEAKKQDISGKFIVVIKVKKGGIIEKVSVLDPDKNPGVPLLTPGEVVVMAFGPASTQASSAVKKDISLLKKEGMRMALTLGSLKVPEWESSNMEFAIAFNFQLNYPKK